MSNVFDDKNEITSSRVAWGMIGDHIFGTVVDKRMVPDQYHPGEEVPVYEMKADGGSFHDIVNKVVAENPTVVNPGEAWSVFARGPLEQRLKRVKLGQKIGLKFVESQPTKKGNDMKVIKVYTSGEMDQAWLDDQMGTAGDL